MVVSQISEVAILPNRGLARILAYFMLISAMVAALSGCMKNKDPYQDMTAQTIYERGKVSYQKGRVSQAIKDFDALEARYPYGEYTDKGQLALISLYTENDEGEAALATANRFIRMHPRNPNVDFAYYMKGVINYHDNFTWAFRNLPVDRSMRASSFAQQSFDDFKTFIEKFPNSKYAPDARKRMIVMREQLAQHELHIARYYQKQGAELAAANRAAYIVNQFPRTNAVPDALEIMHKSFAAIGLTQQSTEALAVLRQNFPDYENG